MVELLEHGNVLVPLQNGNALALAARVSGSMAIVKEVKPVRLYEVGEEAAQIGGVKRGGNARDQDGGSALELIARQHGICGL